MIRTERLTLRKMSSTDFEAFDAVLGDTENMRHSPCTFDEKRVKNWTLSKQKRYQILGFGLFAVCLGRQARGSVMRGLRRRSYTTSSVRRLVNISGGA